MVPVTIDGETVKLHMQIFRAAANRPAPRPTLIVHHGSTGRGRDPAAFSRTPQAPAMTDWFTQRGWNIVVPWRRGRGGSEGRYDEGFALNRSDGYSCEPTLSLPGADRALRDVEAATAAILAMPFVDRSRVVVSGISRGGILSVAHTGQRPDYYRGVINFVGGWLGMGCGGAVNATLFKRGAASPLETLWLYADGDTFYPVAHSRENFDAFRAAGGKGGFKHYPAPEGMNGHFIHSRPGIWGADVEAYLKGQGLAGK